VINQPQTAAQGAITTAGLTVGAITQASSATVASGSVISSNPVAGTVVPFGSAVALVISTGAPVLPAPAQVLMVFSQGFGNRTAAVTTTTPGVRLVAFVGADGPNGANAQAATVSGGGLTWTRVRQQRARSGLAEIWTANAPAVLINANITSTLSNTAFRQQLTVIGFTNVSAVGAANGASTPGTAAVVASTSLVTLGAGSVVYAVGTDWVNTTARTVGAGQTKVREYLSPGQIMSWVQRLNGVAGAAGSSVTLNTTAPTSNQWNMAIVELRR
jgi:PASTA domain-containing protein